MHTILLAAFHPFVLKGLNLIVEENYPESRIVGHCSSVKGFSNLLREHKPDSAIVDVSIIWNSELDLVGEIKKIHPNIEIYFISVHPLDRSVRNYMEEKFDKKINNTIGRYINMNELMSFSIPGSKRDR